MANEAGAGPPPSPRVRLARIARDAALTVDGVAEVGRRPLPGRSTRDGPERLEGVVAAAEPGGGYGVTLYLTAAPVRLHELGDRVREQVVAVAARSGLVGELRSVDVVIEDLLEPLR